MAPKPFKVKAIYDYASPHEDDLGFSNGQIITVTDEEDEDWYYGEYKNGDGVDQQGLFPRNFVEAYEPVTPPRPTRHPRKEPETPVLAIASQPNQALSSINHTREEEQTQAHAEPEAVDDEEGEEEEEEVEQLEDDPESQAQRAGEPDTGSAKVQSIMQDSPSVLESPRQKFPPNVATATATISKTPVSAPQSNKQTAPPISEKPSGGSFRDRIAAFNKPTAPPVAPIKPGGFSQSGSGFVKKPFVPPPPSRNAYVPLPREPPPQKIYRREEELEAAPQAAPEFEDVKQYAISPTDDVAEDQPKPTSLKERIALLQKQQMEQASRHAEAAQKKEKPKRPPKKRIDPAQQIVEPRDIEGQNSQPSEETSQRPPVETEDEDYNVNARPPKRRSKSKEAVSAPRELFSDTNDADQSGGGETEDGGESAIHQAKGPLPPQSPQVQILEEKGERNQNEENENENEGEGEEEEEEEEEDDEDVDPEVKRRMEIRERMAKMSGGMGMAGMFGPPGGLPSVGPKKSKASGDSSKKRTESDDSTIASVPNMALPGMALPGLQKVKTPVSIEDQTEVSKDHESTMASDLGKAEPEDVSDREDISSQLGRARIFNEARAAPPPPPSVPSDSTASAPLITARPVPPMPSERRLPPAPPQRESRTIPPSPAATSQSLSPGSGSDSDDEHASSTPRLAVDTPQVVGNWPSGRQPPPIPVAMPQSPSVLTANNPLMNRQSESVDVAPPKSPTRTGPVGAMERRSSRVPPIPGPPQLAQGRAPPPPPPTAAPSSGRSVVHEAQAEAAVTHSSDSEEVTEYEGDYDTDIAAGESHKDALKSHDSAGSNDTLTEDEANYHHQGLPSLGPPPIPSNVAPRGAPPPPPPVQPPKQSRKSTDMPRGAPPPPPPPKQEADDDYDPFNYSSPLHSTPNPIVTNYDPAITPRAEHGYDGLYGGSTQQELRSKPLMPSSTSFSSPTAPQISASSRPRQSLEAPPMNTSRRSTEVPRASTEQGFIADDVDLGKASQWWLQRKMPPPVFQGRHDVLFEVEDFTAIQQDGRELVLKNVYVLFLDYSKTIVTARFDARESTRADLQQRHEPPPTRLRQDQLEDAHMKFGAGIANMAQGKLNSIIGNGAPSALVDELLHSIPDALPPVGTRAYGALVYANLANATVQQHDEIRAGDIISFRNAKLQGHRGPMKQKYNVEVGKPDHVGIVVDWDGTKKKVRALEQGRESKKVKIESFKLSDLKSGEVKVWRVMPRSWLGWGRN